MPSRASYRPDGPSLPPDPAQQRGRCGPAARPERLSRVPLNRALDAATAIADDFHYPEALAALAPACHPICWLER